MLFLIACLFVTSIVSIQPLVLLIDRWYSFSGVGLDTDPYMPRNQTNNIYEY